MHRPADPSEPAGPVEHWIEEARRGSADALGRLLEACRAYLLLVANRSVDDDLRAKVGASDLVQETFFKAQRDFAQFAGRTEDDLLAWLRRILLNNLANLRRHYCQTEKRQANRELALADVAVDELANGLIDPGASPSSQALAREQDEALLRAVARLPEPYRQVVQWRSFERLPFEEIGQRLDRSAEAARKLWVRAVEQLGQFLGPSDDST